MTDVYVVSEEKFKEILKKRGFKSISHLARKSGVHRNTIAEYLSGGNSPFQTTFLKISEALRIDPFELLEGAPTKESQKIVKIFEPTLNEFFKQNTSLAVVLIHSRFEEQNERTYVKLGFTSGDTGLGQAEFSIYRVKLEEAVRRRKISVECYNLDRSSSSFLMSLPNDFSLFAGNEESFRYTAGFIRGLKRASVDSLPESARSEAMDQIQRSIIPEFR